MLTQTANVSRAFERKKPKKANNLEHKLIAFMENATKKEQQQ